MDGAIGSIGNVSAALPSYETMTVKKSNKIIDKALKDKLKDKLKKEENEEKDKNN